MKNLQTRNYIFLNAKSFLILLSVLIFASCADDDTNIPDETIFLKDVLRAVGGEDAVKNAVTLSYHAEGNTFEYEQDIPSEPSPLTSNLYNYDFYTELTQRKIRYDYHSISFNHPAVYDTAGPLVIINDKKGSTSNYFYWASYYFDIIDPHALFSTEIEAHIKNQKMANPIALLKEILENQGVDASTRTNTFSVNTRVEGLTIDLVIDPDTNMPVSARIKESDFLQGDSTFEVFYEDWTKTGRLKYPATADYQLNGDTLKREKFTDIKFNPPLPEDTFTPEHVELEIAFDEEQADFGILNSQFYHRWSAWNIPWPEPTNNGALDLGNFDLTSVGVTDQYIGPKVKIFGRPDNRLWNVGIETPEGIVLVDAPLNQRWTRSLIDEAKKAFPGKEIISVIATHTHHDHFGGIREAVYEADKVYIAEEGKEFLENTLKRKYTLQPDNLAKSPKNVDIEVVNDVTYLDNGNIEIHRLNPQNSSHVPHSKDMLFVYVPEYEVLIQADQLWNGIFSAIWNGQSVRGFTPQTKEELSNNAAYLLDYIKEKDLKVSKIVAMHGGLGPYQDLLNVAAYLGGN